MTYRPGKTVLPGIITALSAKKVARIKAKTDSKVALEQVRQRTALVNAGLEGKLEAALYLLKLHTLNARVLAGRRLSEEMLRERLRVRRGNGQASTGNPSLSSSSVSVVSRPSW